MINLNITTRNIRELILAYTAVCGEISKSSMKHIRSQSANYFDRNLKTMIDDKLLRQYTYPTGEKVYRLRDHWGTDALIDFSPSLYRHFEFVAGNKSIRYKANAAGRRRNKTNAILFAWLLQQNVQVDLFSIMDSSESRDLAHDRIDAPSPIYYDTIFEGESLLSFRHIYESLDPDTPYFFSSKLLNREGMKIVGEKNLKQSNAYSTCRLRGMLSYGNLLYAAYFTDTYDSPWRGQAEDSARLMLSRLRREFYSESNIPAVIFTTDSFLSDKILLNAKPSHGRQGFMPTSTYRDVYVLPLNPYGPLLYRMLIDPDSRESLNHSLLGEFAIKHETIDGICYGRYIYVFLDNNVGRIKRIHLNEEDDAIIYCHPWQKRALRQKFGGKVDLREVSMYEFTDLLLD